MKNTIILLVGALLLASCSNDADVASWNLSQAADNFEINRRVVFYNSITDTYMLTIEGLCALGTSSTVKAVTVTCKVGDGKYKKHYLGLSDNVTYVAEQIDAAAASKYFYRVTFKPSTILPNINLR